MGGTEKTNNISSRCPSFYMLNATSLAKPHAIQHLLTDISNYNIDIALIVETWFTSSHADSELAIDGFNLFRRDRIGKRKGGGLCAYVKQHIDCSFLNVITNHTDANVEIMWLQCKKDNVNFVLSVCYYPPKPIYDTSVFVSLISDGIEYVTNYVPCEFVAIVGDFNSLDTDFLETDHGFMQLVQQPTHASNLIDKFFINRPDLYTNAAIYTSIVKTKHKAVIVQASTRSTDFSPCLNVNGKTSYCVYDTRAHNIDFLRFTVGTYDWSFLYDVRDINDMYRLFVATVRALINKCIPCKTVKIGSSEPFYITPLVKSLLVKRNRLRRRGKLADADLLASRINAIIIELRKKRLNDLSKSRPKELWKAVRSNTSKQEMRGSCHKLLQNPDDVNNFFAKISTDDQYNLHDITSYYCPVSETDMSSFPSPPIIEILLRKLKNTSPGIDDIPCWFFRSCSYEIADIVSYITSRTLETGNVPDSWRTAIVTPIPKVSNPKSLSDYRPISVTPILSRLTEKIIVQQYLKPSMQEANLLGDQFAYRNTGSTTCALIKAFDFITSALETNRYVNALFVDFSKAFDTVDHVVVIQKLKKLNMPSNIINWIISFLTNRTQIVRCNCTLSGKTTINRGIVQGSALGPFLFCVTASDLKPVSSMNLLVKYADDLTFLIPEHSDQGVNSEFRNSLRWAISNKQSINLKKTKHECIRKSNKVDIPNIEAELEGIESVKEFRLLGVTVDDRLCFSRHVSNVLNVCNQRFYLLKILKEQGMNIGALHSIYVSLIVGKIVYCVCAWGGFIRQGDIDKFNKLFKKAKRYGYTDTVFDYTGLLAHSDLNLFRQVVSNPLHCLHHLLPQLTSFEGRDRKHNFVLPMCKLDLYKHSFLPRCLFSLL